MACFIHPFRCVICGPACSGKSYFVARFLQNVDAMTDVKFGKIVLYFGAWQESYRSLGDRVQFRAGVPDVADVEEFDGREPVLLILDDLMIEAKNKSVIDLFTKGWHHRSISIFFITQNFLYREMRTISLNSSHFIIFKNPRDRSQISHLARQLFPDSPKFLVEAYNDSTSRAHGYLMIDLTQSCPDHLRIKADIFPEEKFVTVYVKKKNTQLTYHLHE